MNPDLRQGNKFFNDSTKYLNQLDFIPPVFGTKIGGGAQDLPRKSTPTKGLLSGFDVDLGKQFGGIRTDRESTLIERMFKSAGEPIFKANNFKGTAKVRNYINSLLAPELQLQAQLAQDKLENRGLNYFNMKQYQKTQILSDIRKKARAGVERVMDKGGVVPETMNLVRQLTAQKSKTLDALSITGYSFDKRFFGFMNISFDEKMDRIMEMEDGYAQLMTLKRMVDTHKEWKDALPY